MPMEFYVYYIQNVANIASPSDLILCLLHSGCSKHSFFRLPGLCWNRLKDEICRPLPLAI